ncbi:MAG: hypothetical protein JO171_20015 [Paludibacterium sp.]|uniref:hypothetical protein n=1 Tax=Paludibacterium sp. TaxID=1917523 RepID=UPI0025FB9B79|nr:hypothetical protein [Paludibacterium sp.]MBV8049440.1 hypothetical protein [Paludibacterium sp.]
MQSPAVDGYIRPEAGVREQQLSDSLAIQESEMVKLRIRDSLAYFLMALSLAGCSSLMDGGDHSLAVSGEVRSGGGSHALSQRQVALLNSWLGEHRSGWGMVLATPPVPDLVVVVKREDGKSASLDFYLQEGWKSALTYFGSGNKEISQASFPAAEVLALKADLMAPQ